MAIGITNSGNTKAEIVYASLTNERLVVGGVLNGSRVAYFTFPEKGLYYVHFTCTIKI